MGYREQAEFAAKMMQNLDLPDGKYLMVKQGDSITIEPLTEENYPVLIGGGE